MLLPQAASDLYGVEIHLLTSHKDKMWMFTKPQRSLRTEKILWLSFLAELHYYSLYCTEGDISFLFAVIGPLQIPTLTSDK